MLEGFADHCLTLEELLMWRVPKWWLHSSVVHCRFS
jgi:hypothetical protein